MQPKVDDIQIIDEEMQVGSDKIDFKGIVLEQFKACGTEYRKAENAQAFINSVMSLYVSLEPYIKNKKEIGDDIKKIAEQIDSVEKRYSNRLIELQKQKNVEWNKQLDTENKLEQKETLPLIKKLWIQLSRLLEAYNYFGEGEWNPDE